MGDAPRGAVAAFAAVHSDDGGGAAVVAAAQDDDLAVVGATLTLCLHPLGAFAVGAVDATIPKSD